MAVQSDLRFTFTAGEGIYDFEVVEFHLVEGLSKTFRLDVDLSCASSTVDFGRILDRQALLTIWQAGRPIRYVHGSVSSFQQGDTGFRRTRYRAIVEPRLARLGLASDWRIFQTLSAPEIAKVLLKKHGLALDYEQRLTNPHQPREYCVQAGETDYHFVERIMREEGFFYGFLHSAEGHSLLVDTLGNSLFQSKLATLVDKPFNKVVAAAIHARLGRFAEHFQLELRDGKALSRGTKARLERAIGRSFEEALRGGTKGPMAELRLGQVLVFLEVWNLYNKLAVADKNSREYVEAAAAVVALTAAGVELGATAVAMAARSSNAAVQQGAKVFNSGLRLVAGVLASSAAVVGATYDFRDFNENINLKRYSIAGMYLLRAVTQLGAASLSISVGLGLASPLFKYLLKKYGSKPIVGTLIEKGAQISSSLATRMVPMLRVFFGLNLVILSLVLIEIFVLPDALQRYLDHCTFRKNRSNGIADTEQREIEILQNAIRSTL